MTESLPYQANYSVAFRPYFRFRVQMSPNSSLLFNILRAIKEVPSEDGVDVINLNPSQEFFTV